MAASVCTAMAASSTCRARTTSKPELLHRLDDLLDAPPLEVVGVEGGRAHQHGEAAGEIQGAISGWAVSFGGECDIGVTAGTGRPMWTASPEIVHAARQGSWGGQGATMKPMIQVVEAPTDADRQVIVVPLRAFNEAAMGPSGGATVAILLRDETGEAVGGLWGRSAFEWLFVDLLYVPETWRGQDLGTELMTQAEAVARRRGCRGIWLSTLAFQARGFYEKLGFTMFGQIDDHPAGGTLFFLSKRL